MKCVHKSAFFLLLITLAAGELSAGEPKLTAREKLEQRRNAYRENLENIEKTLGKKKDAKGGMEKYREAVGNEIMDLLPTLSKQYTTERGNKSSAPDKYDEAYVKELLEEKKQLEEVLKNLRAEGLMMAHIPEGTGFVPYEGGGSPIAEGLLIFGLPTFDFAQMKADLEKEFKTDSRAAGPATYLLLDRQIRKLSIDANAKKYCYSVAANQYLVFVFYFRSAKQQNVSMTLEPGKKQGKVETVVENIYVNFEPQKAKKKNKLSFRAGHNCVVLVCKNNDSAIFELDAQLEAKDPLEIGKGMVR